jgi:hypothetical protein
MRRLLRLSGKVGAFYFFGTASFQMSAVRAFKSGMGGRAALGTGLVKRACWG